MEPLVDRQTVTLRRRSLAGALIALVAIGVFAVVDRSAGVPSPALVFLRLTQAVLALVTLLALRRAHTWPAVANTALAFVIGLSATAVGTAILRGETQSMPVLMTMIVMITATFTGWGPWRQIILAAAAMAALTVNLAALGALSDAAPYPMLPIMLALGVSVWVASEADRHARARHNVEMALRDSETRFRTLAEHAPVPIWMCDRDGHLTYLNPAWGELVPPDVSLSRRFWSAVHPTDRQVFLDLARAALVAQRPYEAECRITTPDGRTRWLAVRGVPRIGPAGVYEGHIGTAVDVTKTKDEQFALAAAHSAAIEAANLKSSFLATMSHEIRTPMHGIFGMTELALETTDATERLEFIRRAKSCARTLMTLLDEVLDLSRIEAGRLELTHEAVDLDEVVQNAVDTVVLAAAQKGLALVVEVTPDVPSTAGGDSNRLRQVLTNLLANAVKFTTDGEVVVRIDVNDDALVVTVRDSGVGIAPDDLPRIFEPFTQADRDVGRRFGGTGLGLAISRRLVSAMEGAITVESTLGVGTTFTVRLPLRPPLGAPLGARYSDVGGTRVLVADGSTPSRLALQRTLEAFGCTVVTASSASAAERAAAAIARSPAGLDVALVDVELDEHHLVRRLASVLDTPGLTVVELLPLRAGVATASQRAGGLALTKPIHPWMLLHTIARVRGALAPTGS